MLESEIGYLASARSAFDKAFLDEIGLINILKGARVFTESGCNCVETDGAAVKFGDNRYQNLVVDFIKAIAVDVEGFK